MIAAMTLVDAHEWADEWNALTTDAARWRYLIDDLLRGPFELVLDKDVTSVTFDEGAIGDRPLRRALLLATRLNDFDAITVDSPGLRVLIDVLGVPAHGEAAR